MDKRYVTPADVDTLVLPWGEIQWLSEPSVTGSDRLATGIVSVAPGQGHERHNHPGCEEIIYVLEGKGEQFVEDEDGQAEKRIVQTGDLIQVPADRYHGTVNIGEDTLRLLVVYQTAEPALQLRNAPDCRIESAKNGR
ncbi:cupin domain-containing protein [Paenibacillus albicereus]|uniref:Cupin domain-containing protein n=1 Tax=Paenibacillus albicereus TaxID=2726185 RepID=A0A6H2H322_9BACL|nr:cupin domain-containing protein [Paenibacillus albicereus]QJC54062.1 cupin domain-containing protein [Paenibacillus albicereus]